MLDREISNCEPGNELREKSRDPAEEFTTVATETVPEPPNDSPVVFVGRKQLYCSFLCIIVLLYSIPVFQFVIQFLQVPIL
jgi:hypothetical protein